MVDPETTSHIVPAEEFRRYSVHCAIYAEGVVCNVHISTFILVHSRITMEKEEPESGQDNEQLRIKREKGALPAELKLHRRCCLS